MSRKVTLTLIGVGAIIALALIYVFSADEVDGNVFVSAMTAVGVITGAYSWANASVHKSQSRDSSKAD